MTPPRPSPPDAAEPIALLRRVAALLRGVSDDDAAAWFVEGVRLYESAAPLGVSLCPVP
jgi:hypothetical protein